MEKKFKSESKDTFCRSLDGKRRLREGHLSVQVRNRDRDKDEDCM